MSKVKEKKYVVTDQLESGTMMLKDVVKANSIKEVQTGNSGIKPKVMSDKTFIMQMLHN